MLDLKYRPKKLSEVLGNEGPKMVISARIRNGSISRKSYLLHGPKGSGKTSLARIISKSIFCDDLTPDGPCGSCESCVESDQGIFMSCEEFDAATQGTVDKMRQIVEELDYGSVDGKPRVLILDEAQRLSKASQDALLKSIEDRRIVCILCTTEPQLIRPAVRSRCEEYSISYPSTDQLVEKLRFVCEQEKIAIDEKSLLFLARKSENCSRLALSLLETVAELGFKTPDEIQKLIGDDPSSTLVDILVGLQGKIDSTTLLSLSNLIRTHGPSEVSSLIVSLDLDIVKSSYGIASQFPCDTSHIECSKELAEISKLIIEKDEITGPELELIILEHFAVRPDVDPVPQKPQVQPVYKMQLRKSEVDVKISARVEQSKKIEIDGIVFSSDEALTSMDSQFTYSENPKETNETEPVVAPVKLDKEKIPMSTKEFSREFRERFGRIKSD